MSRNNWRCLVVHHDDLDGYVGGCICRENNNNVDTLSLNYDNVEKLPKKSFFNKYSHVVIVDYSFPPDLMQWLNVNMDVCWLDHHITAIKKSIEHGYDDMAGLRDTNYCGAELAWSYYEDEPIPEFIKMVGEFDTFRNSGNKDFFNNVVMPFFYGCQSFINDLNPANHRGEYFSGTASVFRNDRNVSKMISAGKPIFEYLRRQWLENAQNNAFVRDVWGYRVLCLNNVENGSMQLEDAFDPDKHDIKMKFHFNGRNWCYGIYTDTNSKPDVHVGEIAARYGGGGHRGAAGFTTNELLDELR